MVAEKLSFTASLIIQGQHRFYSLSVPSVVLAKTCYVTSRYDDPVEGFQRSLDKEKARQIADYIDKGLGTIPTAIILSAQADANFHYTRKNRTVEFDVFNKAFLVLDGQHRVFGFSMADTEIRVPVIIYNGLSRRDETRLFIDINTKQRPVPNELLLDIKALADYENNNESYQRKIFDLFKDEPTSALFGMLSSASKTTDKISRVTFNAAVRPITTIFGGKEADETFDILNAYLRAILIGFKKRAIDNRLNNPYVFRSVIQIFPDVARKVKDKYVDYSVENFDLALTYFFDNISVSKINKRLTGHKELSEHFLEAFKKDFTL